MITEAMMLREEVINSAATSVMLRAERNLADKNSEVVSTMPKVSHLLKPYHKNLLIFLDGEDPVNNLLLKFFRSRFWEYCHVRQ